MNDNTYTTPTADPATVVPTPVNPSAPVVTETPAPVADEKVPAEPTETPAPVTTEPEASVVTEAPDATQQVTQ